jgi:CRISPR-associated protein (TIGR03984 family)
MNQLFGCEITSLDENTCRGVLAWIIKGHPPQQAKAHFKWTLIHCTNGVIWGYYDEVWNISSQAFPDRCPQFVENNLIELRIFGGDTEILIWRNEGTIAGRLLRDADTQTTDFFLHPAEEGRILIGDRLLDGPQNGFSRVGTATGQEQVVPLECSQKDFQGGRWPLRLKVRNYFERDEKTGSVRVAASRLVELYKERCNGA